MAELKIGVVRESNSETRVALTPDIVCKLIKQYSASVFVESNAGYNAGFADRAYMDSGASIVDKISKDLGLDILLYVQGPEDLHNIGVSDHTLLLGLQNLNHRAASIAKLARNKNSVVALELVPRISRAQSMDVLSSQANLAGYKAVLLALEHYNGIVPLMMTAAGTIKPAKFLVLGAGVAGLQAIATAKRLGGVVFGFDVRPSVKQQVESLGGKFVEIASQEDLEGSGGYAGEVSDDYKLLQKQALQKVLETTNIVITTAQIPNKPAPMLIDREMLSSMPNGSVIIDLAASSGGNCEITENDATVMFEGVKVIGHSNIPALLPNSSSILFANNCYQLLRVLLAKDGFVNYDSDDEIVNASMLIKQGEIVHKHYFE